jgi:hypothetical protein
MRTMKSFLYVVAILVTLLSLAICSGKVTVPEATASSAKPIFHDPVFGSWIAVKANSQKLLLHPDWKYEFFAKSTDQKSCREGTFEIVEKIGDHEGNIVYRMNMSESSPKATLRHGLWRMALDRTKLEWVDVQVQDAKDLNWPKSIEDKDSSYGQYLLEQKGT